MKVSFSVEDIKAMAEGQNPRINHPEYDFSIVIQYLARKLLKYAAENKRLKNDVEVLNATIQDVY